MQTVSVKGIGWIMLWTFATCVNTCGVAGQSDIQNLTNEIKSLKDQVSILQEEISNRQGAK